MAHQARKNEIRELRDDLGIGHQDAARILEEPDFDRRENLCRVLADFSDITTYAQAVEFLDNPPTAYQTMCGNCGWTWGMICPECSKGCGCDDTGCTGWRHHEYPDAGGEYPVVDNGCEECGAGSSGDPYGECLCYDNYEDSEVA